MPAHIPAAQATARPTPSAEPSDPAPDRPGPPAHRHRLGAVDRHRRVARHRDVGLRHGEAQRRPRPSSRSSAAVVPASGVLPPGTRADSASGAVITIGADRPRTPAAGRAPERPAPGRRRRAPAARPGEHLRQPGLIEHARVVGVDHVTGDGPDPGRQIDVPDAGQRGDHRRRQTRPPRRVAPVGRDPRAGRAGPPDRRRGIGQVGLTPIDRRMLDRAPSAAGRRVRRGRRAVRQPPVGRRPPVDQGVPGEPPPGIGQPRRGRRQAGPASRSAAISASACRPTVGVDQVEIGQRGEGSSACPAPGRSSQSSRSGRVDVVAVAVAMTETTAKPGPDARGDQHLRRVAVGPFRPDDGPVGVGGQHRRQRRHPEPATRWPATADRPRRSAPARRAAPGRRRPPSRTRAGRRPSLARARPDRPRPAGRAPPSARSRRSSGSGSSSSRSRRIRSIAAVRPGSASSVSGSAGRAPSRSSSGCAAAGSTIRRPGITSPARAARSAAIRSAAAAAEPPRRLRAVAMRAPSDAAPRRRAAGSRGRPAPGDRRSAGRGCRPGPPGPVAVPRSPMAS